MKTLNRFKPGEKGMIKKIEAKGNVRRRLFDMGVTPGATITMIKTAPMGDPMEITIRGYQLSLRKTEAKFIIMDTNEGSVNL